MSLVANNRQQRCAAGVAAPMNFGDASGSAMTHHMAPPHPPMATFNHHRMNVNASTFFNNSNSSNSNRNWSHQSQQQLPQAMGDGNHGGLMSPKLSASSMYFNFSRQQRYVPNDAGRSGYPNGCHGVNGTGLYHHQQQLQHNSSMQSTSGLNTTADSGFSSLGYDTDINSTLNVSGASSCNTSSGSGGYPAPPVDNSVTLQISNIDTSIEDRALKNYLIGKLKPITPVLSFVYEGLSMVKIRLPSMHHAKQVVAFLHRKKIRHKRISVAYTSTLEPSTLRCQVAGLLKVRTYILFLFGMGTPLLMVLYFFSNDIEHKLINTNFCKQYLFIIVLILPRKITFMQ